MQTHNNRLAFVAIAVTIASGAMLSPSAAAASAHVQVNQAQSPPMAEKQWKYYGLFALKTDCVEHGKEAIKRSSLSEYRCANRSRPHDVPVWSLSVR